MSPAVPKTSISAAANGASGWPPQSTRVPSMSKSSRLLGAAGVWGRAATALLPPARRLFGREEGGDAVLAVGGGARLRVDLDGQLHGLVERAAKDVEQQALGAGDRLGAAGRQHLGGELLAGSGQAARGRHAVGEADRQCLPGIQEAREQQQLADVRAAQAQRRSEERRVGKECR